MSAGDHVQPKQLAMFMSAHDIVNNYAPNPGDRYSESTDYTSSSGGTYHSSEYEETDDEFWERKNDEAWESGVAQSIIEEGVKEPVNLSSASRTIGNGHHRVAVMHDQAPHEVIPVLHHDRILDAIRGGYEPSMRRARGLPERFL